MHLLPTQDEVVNILRDTGALRDGHFEYPDGMHSNEYLQTPLVMRPLPARADAQRGPEPIAAFESGDPRQHTEFVYCCPRNGRASGGLWNR